MSLIKEAKFTLHDPKTTEPTYINLRYSCLDGQLKYSIQQTILPGEWDFDQQRPTGKNNRKLYSELERISRVVADYRDYCKSKYAPVMKDGLIDELQKYNIGKKIIVVKPKEGNLLQSFQTIIEEAISGEYLNPENGRRYEPDTARAWIKTTIVIALMYAENKKPKELKNFMDVEKEKILSRKGSGSGKGKGNDNALNWNNFQLFMDTFNPNLSFDEITEDFYNTFIQYCTKNNFSVNTIGRMIKDLRKLMNECAKRKLHTNFAFQNFKVLKEKTSSIFLTEDEIERLYQLDLSHNKHWDTLRDRFIICCHTGLRISDMMKLNLDHIYRHKQMIHLINKKTCKEVKIPIHYRITEIMEKYKGELPKQHSKPTVNQEIKLICKEAGINEEIRYVKTIGGRKVEFVKEKWELISTHTGRRSMVTGMLMSGIDVIQIAPITAQSLHTVRGYYKASPEENAAALLNHEFFQRKSAN
jgi:site-specific recombinase XerD